MALLGGPSSSEGW